MDVGQSCFSKFLFERVQMVFVLVRDHDFDATDRPGIERFSATLRYSKEEACRECEPTPGIQTRDLIPSVHGT
jgi:hypothetical protein